MRRTKPPVHRNRKKYLAIAAVVLLCGVVGVLAATRTIDLFGTKTSPTEHTPVKQGDINYDPPTREEQDAVDQNKTTDPPKPPVTPPPATPTTEQVAIQSVEQSGPGGDVVVKTELRGIGWKTCTLTFRQGNTTITRTADVLFQEAFSTCLGFSLKASDFPASGNWQVSLQATTSGNSTVNASDKNVTVIK